MKIPQILRQVVLTPTLEYRGGSTSAQGQRRGRDQPTQTGRTQHIGDQQPDWVRPEDGQKVFVGADRKAGVSAQGPKPAGKLEPFKAYLGKRLQAGVWNARVLLRELRSRNYTGGYTLLTDWLRPQREAARVIAVRRFETAPGKQAQVDWGHLGTLTEAGEAHAMWGFTMILGCSRRMMAEAATNQKLGTLLRMHEAAFQELGGIPAEILYDRMKTIWTGTDERGEIIW